MAFFEPFGNMFGPAQESEEERRRREEEERQRAEQERLRVERETPVKQTIEIDPVTGAQKIKIEGSAYNLSEANPMTPTVMGGPVAPVVDQSRQMPEPYLGTPGFNPQATTPTMMPTQAPVVDQTRRPVISDTGEIMGYETPQESVMGAATNAPVAPAVPGMEMGPPREAMMPVSTAAPTTAQRPPSQAELAARRLTEPMEAMPEGIAGPAPGVMGEKDWAQTFARSQQDPQALATIQADATAPSWVRQLAAETQYENMRVQKLNQRAEQMVTKAVETGNMLDIDRAIKKEGEDGSILKAFLYTKMGLNDLARAEQAKLGGGSWQTVTDPATGQTGMVKFAPSGLPTEGINSDGSAMTTKQLAGFGAGGGAKNLDIVGGTYVNDKTGEVGRVVTDKRTGRSYIQTDKGVRDMTGFRPQSSGGSLADQRARLIQEINLKLQGKGKEEAMAILRDYNSKLVGQGLSPVQPTELNINVGQIGGGAPTTTAAPAAPVAPAAAPAPATTPVQAAPAAPVSPTAPRATTTTTPVATTTPAPVTTTPPPPAGGRRPTATEIEATGTAQKEEAKIAGEDIGKIRRDQTASESQADYLISKVQGLIIDPATGQPNPGFEVSVGASVQPGFQFIPGTDKASWYAAYDEVKGQQFLTAVKELKGMGALSNQEGEAATRAISRMSTMTSEKEFRRAAEDFQDIIARGIDRNRAKLNQPPKYQTPEASERDRQDRAAVEWLKKNAKDPKAKEVRQRLKDRGIL